MNIWVYAICRNESAFVSRWLDSMEEADGIAVLDTGSTDDSATRLRARGALVVQESIQPWRFDAARNRSLALVPETADLCVCTDLDEVFQPGWRTLLEQAWTPGTTRARYRYTWSFLPNGQEGHVFYLDKIHTRHGYCWLHPVHEVLTRTDGAPETFCTVHGMQLDHHPDPNKSRAQYLPLLELSVAEDPTDDRSMHYLGREYMFRGEWGKSIETLERHLALPRAVWADERCASMRYIARCCLQLKQPDAAEAWYLRAAAEAPHLREPWVELAWLWYQRQDWEGVALATARALAIAQRPATYISEAASWGSLPWDLRSLALYHTGRIAAAADCARQALALDPENDRLQRNLSLMDRAGDASAKFA